MHTGDYLRPREANFVPLTPVDFLIRSVQVYPDRPALVDGSQTMTYRQFGEWVARIAVYLQSRGIGVGDVVSVLASNSPYMLALHYAVPMVGAVLNTLNYRLDEAAIAYILGHGETALLATEPRYAELAASSAKRAGTGATTVVLDGKFDKQVEGVAGAQLHCSAITDEWQPICLNYTSGTTGHPKGVVYHHRGAFLNSIANVHTLGMDAGTVYLWTLPMFHCNGWQHTWAVTAAGGTHVCLDRVEPEQIFAEIARCGVSHFCCAPVVLYMLLAHAEQTPVQMGERPVKVATGGAAPTPKLIAGLDALGIELLHLYGLTESYGPATVCGLRDDWGASDPETKADLLSRQGVRHQLLARADVVDQDGEQVAADGQTLGEIVLRGNTLMAGYYKDPEATSRAFAGGVFHTGDLAVRHPDGYIQIKDRAKDIIISGGENISSLEVETVIHMHPAVMLAAVVAVPHPKWGETPCACIELKENVPPPSEQEIIEFCRQHLAHFKVPRRVVFAVLPKTATGKIQKYQLREELAQNSND